MNIIVIFCILLILGCEGKVISKQLQPPRSVQINDDFVYLISLDGFFTQKEIDTVQNIDPKIKYYLTSGHSSQRSSDKEFNFKNAKEFVDIKDKKFLNVMKIRFGGSLISDHVELDVLENDKKEHFITSARIREL